MHYVKKLESFKTNESVTPIGDKYLVNGITIPQRVVNAYSKKVKEQTGKDLKQIYSESQIAEELIKYVVDKFLDVEALPVSALIGGEEEMVEEEPEMQETDLATEAPIEEQPSEEVSDENVGGEEEPEAFEDIDTNENPDAEDEDTFEEPTEEVEEPEAPIEDLPL